MFDHLNVVAAGVFVFFFALVSVLTALGIVIVLRQLQKKEAPGC